MSLHNLSLNDQRCYLLWVTTGASVNVIGAVIVGIRKSPTGRVPRRINIVQELT